MLGLNAPAAFYPVAPDAAGALRRGTMRSPSKVTVREAADAWLAAAREDVIRIRSGDPYKPSVLRSYERALRLRVLPALGSVRLSAVRRVDVQGLADRLLSHAAGYQALKMLLGYSIKPSPDQIS